MSHRNSSLENHEEPNMHPDNITSLPNSLENSSTWKRYIHVTQLSQISQRNSSFENHEESNMLPDNITSFPNSLETSTANGSHDHTHLLGNTSSDNDYEDSDSSHYSVFFFPLHDFEKKTYIYVWTFMVILTAFANVLIVAVFVRKSMRTTTNLILLVIAISDSLTGLVTLPTYIYVFTRGKQVRVGLNEDWCEAFMISKFYISKAFHTASIWETLLLGFQRFFCVWFPFKTKSWFTTRRTLIALGLITIFAFVIHTYHLNEKKADKIQGFCQWDIEDPCVESCTFLWITLLLVHLLPCVLLFVLTILMIQKLFHRNIRKESLSVEQNRERDQHNKRVSKIVICIAIIFLLPEIPYGIFLLLTVIKMHSGEEILSLRENRLFHVVYEIALLISFHANFWVYITMTRRFRDELKSMFLDALRKLFPKRATVPFPTVSIEGSLGITNSAN